MFQNQINAGLDTLIGELETRRARRDDLVVSSTKIHIAEDGTLIYPSLNGNESDSMRSGSISKVAHTDLATMTGIPSKYYQKMQEATPDLLAANINRWLRIQPKNVMLRSYRDEAQHAHTFTSNTPVNRFELEKFGGNLLMMPSSEFAKYEVVKN